MPDYCEGDPNPKVAEFDAAFQKRWGSAPVLAYPVLSYEMAYALKAAVEAAGSTEGTAIRDALETLPPTDYLTGPISWSDICHNAQGRDMRVVEYQNGKGKFLQLIRPSKIAQVDPGNPCEAVPTS
jgi:branched-chain amino acid transport system substrate-binding protein